MKAFGKFGLLASLTAMLSFSIGCSRHDNSERYILVTVNSKLAYWQEAAAGLAKAGRNTA